MEKKCDIDPVNISYFQEIQHGPKEQLKEINDAVLQVQQYSQKIIESAKQLNQQAIQNARELMGSIYQVIDRAENEEHTPSPGAGIPGADMMPQYGIGGEGVDVIAEMNALIQKKDEYLEAAIKKIQASLR